jgi:hypothetical protein
MSTLTLAAAGMVLADNDKGRGSPIGLFVILVLCIAVYFLWRSLNKHLKRIPPSFDPPVADPHSVSPDVAQRESSTDSDRDSGGS